LVPYTAPRLFFGSIPVLVAVLLCPLVTYSRVSSCPPLRITIQAAKQLKVPEKSWMNVEGDPASPVLLALGQPGSQVSLPKMLYLYFVKYLIAEVLFLSPQGVKVN